MLKFSYCLFALFVVVAVLVIRIPESGIHIYSVACGIRNPANFCFGTRNPGLWKSEDSSRNPESY